MSEPAEHHPRCCCRFCWPQKAKRRRHAEAVARGEPIQTFTRMPKSKGHPWNVSARRAWVRKQRRVLLKLRKREKSCTEVSEQGENERK